jgi:ferredoxin-NADP reductase
MPQELATKVIEVIRRTPNVKSARVATEAKADFQAGQFLRVALGPGAGLSRYLSISNSPTEPGYLEFTKKLTASEFSQALDSLKPGDALKVTYPFGKFVLDEAAEKIAFISGGIGITPIRSIVKYAVDKGLATDIALLYANRTFADIAFRADLEQMQKRHSRLKVVHVLGEAAPGFDCRVGRIDGAVIKREIADYRERKFYLCGPPQMVEAMKKILCEELGTAQGQVVTENFQGY